MFEVLFFIFIIVMAFRDRTSRLQVVEDSTAVHGMTNNFLSFFL